ncbi:MAG: MFS transporter [Proteobacteria bacterium]|nr:MFS transporter [Pseudomonadota bacterium]MBK7114816.1 MFS transporter [Pseudomonadota bacterium]MBK9251867.1 MFS transporter [Pseudomonadota bacterium]MCC6631483.1 MFS transporter [Gammaproteobacteria bacterium]
MSATAWSPFRHGSFALLWGASLVSNIGSWMHDMAAAWFMTTLAPTPIMVALVQSAGTLPVCLLALPAGTLADRMDKRRLLLVVQVIMLLLASTLGLLVLNGLAQAGMLLAITFAMGICVAVMSPTWQSIIPRLVPPQDLQPAVALHAVGINISRAIGPALGGVIIVAMGIAWPFLINAASFVAVIVALWLWRPPPAATPRNPSSFIASMREGLSHAGKNQTLKDTLVRSVLFYTFGSAYWALLPLVAREQLHGGPSLFGVLTGCIGAGAVFGALLLPALRRRHGLDRVLVVGILGTAASLCGFALFEAPVLGMLTSLLAGASWIAGLSSLNVAAQLAVPDWVRARGMALYTTTLYGSLAVGSMVWGQVATYLSLGPTLLIAAAGAVGGLALGRRRRLQVTRPA